MKYDEFSAWLVSVERELPVTEWTAGGFHVWPLMRVALYISNFDSVVPRFTVDSGMGARGRVVASALSRWVSAFLIDRRHNEPAARKADAVFLASSRGRQPMLDGRYLNPRLAPYIALLENLGRDCLVWEMSTFGDYNVPRTNPSFFIQPLLIWERFVSQLRALPPLHFEGFDELVERANAGGLTFVHANPTRLVRDVSFVRHLADRFKRWMEQIGPTHGFVVDYSLREQAFCLACSELGITSVELQHGIQGKHNPAYGGWVGVPPAGYETRPDVFWCWTKSDADAINEEAEHSPAAHIAVAGGDPWQDMWLDSSSLAGQKLAHELRLLTSTAPDARHVLVCLTWVGPVLPEMLGNTMRAAPSHWRFLIRLHPNNQSARRVEALAALSELGISTDSLDVATRLPLPGLLQHVDCVIVVGLSTVIKQAVGAGVPVLACGNDTAQASTFFRDDLEAGRFRVPTSPAEMLADVAAACERPRSERQRGAGRPSADTAMRRVLAIDQGSSRRASGV